jgi:hypothetical protein
VAVDFAAKACIVNQGMEGGGCRFHSQRLCFVSSNDYDCKSMYRKQQRLQIMSCLSNFTANDCVRNRQLFRLALRLCAPFNALFLFFHSSHYSRNSADRLKRGHYVAINMTFNVQYTRMRNKDQRQQSHTLITHDATRRDTPSHETRYGRECMI